MASFRHWSFCHKISSLGYFSRNIDRVTGCTFPTFLSSELPFMLSCADVNLTTYIKNRRKRIRLDWKISKTKRNVPACPSVTETRSEQNVRSTSDMVTLILFLTLQRRCLSTKFLDCFNQWHCARVALVAYLVHNPSASSLILSICVCVS